MSVQGKVCLSLLGTFHGTNDSEKWGADSSIFQVLMSVLSQILVPDPYYAEPVAPPPPHCTFATSVGRSCPLLLTE